MSTCRQAVCFLVDLRGKQSKFALSHRTNRQICERKNFSNTCVFSKNKNERELMPDVAKWTTAPIEWICVWLVCLSSIAKRIKCSSRIIRFIDFDVIGVSAVRHSPSNDMLQSEKFPGGCLVKFIGKSWRILALCVRSIAVTTLVWLAIANSSALKSKCVIGNLDQPIFLRCALR